MPDGRQETVYTFGWYMRKFIKETSEVFDLKPTSTTNRGIS
jgi:hypothetical protein